MKERAHVVSQEHDAPWRTNGTESTGNETLDAGFLGCGCDVYLCGDGAAGYGADEDVDSGEQGGELIGGG